MMEVRGNLLDAFVSALTPVGLLDRFKIAGTIATWWNEIQYDLKTLVAQGFSGLLDGWVDSIEDAMEDSRENHFEPSEDPLVLKLIPGYLEELELARQDIVALEQQKEAFEDQNDGEDGNDEVKTNYAEELKTQIADLKNRIKEEKKTRALNEKVATVQEKIRELEEKLKPYQEILERLREAKKKFKDLQRRFIEHLRQARGALSDQQDKDLVLSILFEKLQSHLETYVSAHRQEVISAVENWWDKYRVTMRDIESRREVAKRALGIVFSDHRYAT